MGGLSPRVWVMDVCIEYFDDRKVFYDVCVMFLLEEHLFAELAYKSGGAWSAQQSIDFNMYSGGAQPFALDNKGGE